ncbi:hypothetical protein LNKW23_24120 [Paralimibaculum aggregatum]|uniref:VTT domain-containing protein n=1 Tax=Paralimibaculum aggregatum TaxID=3036245 RepID=A0ABQ6LLL2_9RHOB|nr:VTT domain-containing protein [Limibaculum sp. NKW23]GMG83199.1 hypothetical protein LNKW23_24120 [Limibaculum sp. NKW23]
MTHITEESAMAAPTESCPECPPARRAAGRGGWLRRLPLLLIGLGAAAGLVFASDYLSFDALAAHYEELRGWRDANYPLAALAFVAAYALVVAFSIPGAIWLTLLGGLLFGTWTGAALVIAAATLGATGIFLAARTALGDWLKSRAQGWLGRLERGFHEGEVSFLLILRLLPVVPFWVANLAPAFLGARLGTFVWTTFLGIMPATVVYTSVGAGLGTEIAEGRKPDLGVIFEPHILGPLIGLAALAALPVVLRRLGLGLGTKKENSDA